MEHLSVARQRPSVANGAPNSPLCLRLFERWWLPSVLLGATGHPLEPH